MDDPLRQDVEVFSPDPEQSVARTPVEKPSGIFTVLVPDLEEADHVTLMSSTAPELARFSLRADSEGGDA
jgi:hypothetical protein